MDAVSLLGKDLLAKSSFVEIFFYSVCDEMWCQNEGVISELLVDLRVLFLQTCSSLLKCSKYPPFKDSNYTNLLADMKKKLKNCFRKKC